MIKTKKIHKVTDHLPPTKSLTVQGTANTLLPRGYYLIFPQGALSLSPVPALLPSPRNYCTSSIFVEFNEIIFFVRMTENFPFPSPDYCIKYDLNYFSKSPQWLSNNENISVKLHD